MQKSCRRRSVDRLVVTVLRCVFVSLFPLGGFLQHISFSFSTSAVRSDGGIHRPATSFLHILHALLYVRIPHESENYEQQHRGVRPLLKGCNVRFENGSIDLPQPSPRTVYIPADYIPLWRGPAKMLWCSLSRLEHIKPNSQCFVTPT